MSRIRFSALIVAAVAMATALAGSPAAATSSYNPKIDPSKFTNRVTNKYFPMAAGTVLHYRGVREWEPATVN